jgi:hypothetical protein
MDKQPTFEEFSSQLNWHCAGFTLGVYSRAELCDRIDELTDKFRGLS